jgi:heme/copper-type cytochrome/quinol oxidase subunit 2
MAVVVESEEEYNAWLESQEEFIAEKPNTVDPNARAEAPVIETEESATLYTWLDTHTTKRASFRSTSSAKTTR